MAGTNEFMDSVMSKDGYHVQIGQRDFLTALHDILITQGEVITIDYGCDPNNYVHDQLLFMANLSQKSNRS